MEYMKPPIPHSSFAILHSSEGFSLLELLIVLGIMSLLLAAGSGVYRNFGKNVELSSTSQAMSADIRQIQSKAMTGESSLRWGVSLVNSSDDRYDLFSLTDAGVYTTSTTIYLPKSITFSDPSEGTVKNIIFSKISGSTTATTTTITSEGSYATTTISSIGTIY